MNQTVIGKSFLGEPLKVEFIGDENSSPNPDGWLIPL